MALQQVFVAILGDLGEPEIGFGGAEVTARLLELLVDFRSLDFGQELAFFDMRPYVEIPTLQITVRPGKNRRLDIRLNVPRQHNFLQRCGPLRRNDRNCGHCHVRGFTAQRGAGVHALQNAGNQNPSED